MAPPLQCHCSLASQTLLPAPLFARPKEIPRRLAANAGASPLRKSLLPAAVATAPATANIATAAVAAAAAPFSRSTDASRMHRKALADVDASTTSWPMHPKNLAGRSYSSAGLSTGPSASQQRALTPHHTTPQRGLMPHRVPVDSDWNFPHSLTIKISTGFFPWICAKTRVATCFGCGLCPKSACKCALATSH